MSGDQHDHPELSALIDGELDDEVAAHWQRLVAADPSLADELDGVARGRELVRALPEVEPPEGFIEVAIADAGRVEFIDERRSRRRLVAASAVATAAVWLLALANVDLGAGDGTPLVADLVAVHQSSAMTGETAETARPVSFPPGRIESLQLLGVEESDGVTHAVYAGAERSLSVFRRAGTVDWDRLDGGEMVSIDGLPAWQGSTDQGHVLVVEIDRMTYAFVSEDPVSTELVPSELPAAPAPSWWDRVNGLCEDVVDAFALG